jgi:uncharacterized protein YndB with AHSA1/START domain
MIMQTPDTCLTLVRTLQASPQEIFKAWTDPGLIHRWMSSSGGTTVAEVDARIGGHYRLETKTSDGLVHVTTGVYRELEPGRRLVKTWIYEGPFPDFVGHETLLTLELREVGPGLTELTLKHERLPSDAYRDSIRQGWSGLLDNLVAFYVSEPVAPSLPEA